MKNCLYSGLKKNFRDKNFNIRHYEKLFDIYLDNISCDAGKCDKLCQIKRSFAFVLNKYKQIYTIKERNEEVFFQVLHDIKSPSLGIKFALEGAIRHQLEEDIYNINKAVLDLIQNFLTIYNFQNAHANYEHEEFDVIKIINSQRDTYKYLLLDKNLKIVFKNNSKDGEVASDKRVVARIIANLITNAVKYAPKNTKIDIKVADSCENLLVSVTNEIEHDDIQNNRDIFKKFNTSGGDDSFGLGLFICKRLAGIINSKIGATHKNNSITFELIIPKM